MSIGKGLLRSDYERAIALGDQKTAQELLKRLGSSPGSRPKKPVAKPKLNLGQATKGLNVDPGRF